ncbi:MAG: D-alanyl-D-alanine carboxypeptidase family protein [Oscillospiraceae bacterium]
MKKVRLLSLFLICLLLTGLFSAPALAAAPSLTVEAKAALLLDGETGEVLYEKNAEEKLYPASLTKVMTALLVFEAIDAGQLSLQQEITAPAAAFVGLSSDGSTANIEAGEVLTVDDLLACMLINSANEAASILACAVGGTIADFVSRMNARAAELGCENTHFVNPTGLHDGDHYTTAWDLYRITQAALAHPHFLEICDSKSWEVPETNLHDARTLHSTNYLISNWRALGYLYSGAHGVKTGNTSEAGHCLISTATRTGRSLFGVILGAGKQSYYENNRQVEKVGSFLEMARMFDWGFDNFTRQTLVTSTETVTEARVALSREANYVVVHPAEDVQRLLPNDLEPEKLTRDISLYQEVFNAPIQAGDELGTMTLRHGDTVYATVPLLAMNDVSASWILTLHYHVVSFFSRPAVKLVCLVLLIAAVLLFTRHYGRRRHSRHGTPTRSQKNYRGRRRF